MPELIKLYIRNVIIGFGIAAVFVAMLLYFDVMGLRHLIIGSDAGVIALFVLWFMNGIVFAGVQFAWAVMSMAGNDHRDGGARAAVHTVVHHQPLPVRVAQNRPNHR